MKESQDVHLAFRCPSELKSRLSEEASVKKTNMSSIVREACLAYLQRRRAAKVAT